MAWKSGSFLVESSAAALFAFDESLIYSGGSKPVLDLLNAKIDVVEFHYFGGKVEIVMAGLAQNHQVLLGAVVELQISDVMNM